MGRNRLAWGKGKAGQSSLEYLVTYGWALLIVVAATGLLYFYVLVPANLPSNTCTFIVGVQCDSYYVGINPANHSAVRIGMLASNPEYYPIKDPVMVISLGSTNFTSSCTPQYVSPGETFICNVSVPDSFGKSLRSNVYIEDYNCGLSKYGEFNGTCADPPLQVYKGVLDYAVTPGVQAGKTGVAISPGYVAVSANGAQDPLNVSFYFMGSRANDVTLNLTLNNSIAKLESSNTFTGSTGVASDYIYSTHPGEVMVTAHYDGYSNSTVVTFT